MTAKRACQATTKPIRFYHHWPIPFPGGLIRQHRQWYALGRDVHGDKRCGVGATRKAARHSLARTLAAMERYWSERRAEELRDGL